MMRTILPLGSRPDKTGRSRQTPHILLLYLSVLCAALLGAGCQATAEDDSPAPTVASPAATVAAATTTLRWMGPAFVSAVDIEISARCAQEIGVEIELLPAPANPLDRLGLYRQFLWAESDDIDLIDFDVIWSGLLAPHLLDLNPHLSDQERAQYFPIYLQNNSVDGALVGLPQMGDIGLLYYRTDLLEKHGFQQPPSTWTELTEMAATIQAAERTQNPEFWGYVWQGNVYEGLTVNALEWQASMGGDPIVGAEGRPPADASSALWSMALDRAAAWVGSISPPAVTVFQEEEARAVFQSGNAVFMRNWPYAYPLGQAEDSLIRDRFDVTRLPKGENGAAGRHASVISGQQIGVSRYSRNPDAAAFAARCLTAPTAQKRRALAAGIPPAIPALYADADVQARIPAAAQIAESFAKHAVARPAATTGSHYSEISLVYFTEVNRVLSGEQNGAAAAARIAEQFEKIWGDER